MEFRLLGPLELWADGSRHHLGSVKERLLLAVLLYAEGAPVPVDTLMRRVWAADPPPSGAATLQSNISRLRSRLRDAVGDRVGIEFSARNYTLNVPADTVDRRRFRTLRRQAGAAAAEGNIERAVLLLREAESLWRAEPLAEFSGAWAAAMKRRLIEDLRQVREQRITWELDLGRHAELVAELYDLLAHEPAHEPYARHLMLALHRCDRHGDALAVYRDTRLWLSRTLGADPSPELERLQGRILTRDPALRARPSRLAVAGPPDNLQRDIGDFSGRQHELAVLLSRPQGETTALPVTVVHGMGGVGKTALITHAAHRLRSHYPDGRFHLHLRAHHEQPPIDPADALARLLPAIGVPAEKLPPTLDARAALWRERTAHRSVLLLLDDARSAAQVRPLLPGSPTCRVFITSRYRLADLEGTQSLNLDVPDIAEATEMFSRIAGAQRAADQEAVRQVVDICNRYPLAIRLAASLCRHREAWDAHDLAELLMQSASPMDEIDAQPGISTVFDFSYRELRAADRQLLRALALHPGPDLTLDAIASLADIEPAQARKGVAEFVNAHMLEEPIKDRYRLHDVVREMARTVGRRHDTFQERHAVMQRILDYYLMAADRSDRLAYPQRRRLDPAPARTAGSLPDIDSSDAALAWLDLNRGNLLAAAQLAATRDSEHAMYFSHVLDRSFHTWGMWQTAAEMNAAALGRARVLGDRALTGQLLVERAAVLRPQGAHGEARSYATEALALGQRVGDEWLQGEALDQIGIVDLVSGRLPDALKRFQEARPLHQRAGNEAGEAETLGHQGIALAHLGHRVQASRRFQAALEIHQRCGNTNGQIKALNNIGEVHVMQGRHAKAREYYERSLALVRVFGGRQELAILYNNLGIIHRESGSTAQAVDYFFMALENYQAMGDRAGQIDSLINLAITWQGQGRYGDARGHLTQADAIAQEIDDQSQRQRILAACAALQHRTGQSETALATYRRALRMARDLNQRYEEAATLEAMARIVEEREGLAASEAHWRQALAIYRELDLEPQAHAVLGHLEGAADAGTDAGTDAGGTP